MQLVLEMCSQQQPHIKLGNRSSMMVDVHISPVSDGAEFYGAVPGVERMVDQPDVNMATTNIMIII